VEAVVGLILTLDRTPPAPPQLYLIASPVTRSPVKVTGWAEGNTIVRLYLDGGEALSLLQPQDGNFTVEVEVGAGEHQLYAIAEDVARNRSQPSNTVNFLSTADITPPQTTIAITPVAEDRVRVELSAGDDPQGSGVDRIFYFPEDGDEWLEYSEPLILPRGSELWFRAVDLAGNLEPVNSRVLEFEVGVLDRVVVLPEQVSVKPGQVVELEARGLDSLNNELTDVSFAWTLLDPSAGTLEDLGGGRARFTVQVAGLYPDLIRVEGTKDDVTRTAFVSVWVAAPDKGVVSGRVVLEGRADHSGVRVLADGAATVTSESGHFALELEEGTYTIQVTMPGYLTATRSGVSAAPGGVTDLGTVVLLGGDVDRDGGIDTDDLWPFIGSFNTTGTDLPTDINADGIVDIRDLVLVGKNYGRDSSPWP
jgi:hypothetical protein